MADAAEYVQIHAQAVERRRDWLEKTELPRLKEELRSFQSSFVNIYQILLKKGFLQEDPYKQDTKVGELQIPPTDAFTETKKLDELSIRLSDYDNQLDFLVNFYQFSSEFLTLDRIKRIVGLVKYIDWSHFTNASPSHNTKALAEILASVKSGVDQISMTIINDSMTNIVKARGNAMTMLKELADYQRESIKSRIRLDILPGLTIDKDTGSAGPAKRNEIITQMRKKYAAVLGGPFYPEIAEELINEDYTPGGAKLREEALKALAIPDTSQKKEKKQISFKIALIQGLQILGSASTILADILLKIDENNATLESVKKGFWERMRKLFREMINKEPDPVIYKLQYLDPVKGTSAREELNYYNLRQDLEKKIRTLGAMRPDSSRIKAMNEEQLLLLLERGVGDVQNIHKILSALDDYFKAEAPAEVREKIKGIKPELSSMKNAIVNANQKRYEYSAQKDEAEQFKRLGLDL
jgi:hypothetical protein